MTTLSLVPDDTKTDAWAAGVKRLQRMLPPQGFAIDRWALICLDCSRLLEQHGTGLLRLGWPTEAAFGAHPHAPATAVRCYGLELLLNGGGGLVVGFRLLTERKRSLCSCSAAVPAFQRLFPRARGRSHTAVP